MTRTILSNGIETSYRLEGPESAPVVMLSNSLLTDYGMWDQQVEALTARFRLLRYDTRGHGGTQATVGPYSMDMLADDAVGLLDALGVKRAHFVGLSMGGMIGQLLASRYPERLHSVVLSDTACHLPPESVWDERIALAHSKGTAAFVGPMTERWLTPQYREQNPGTVKRLGEMISRTSVNGLVGCAHAIKKMNQLSILSGIATPALIVVGEQDLGTPVAAAQVLHREIRGSRLEIVKRAGHLPNVEQADTFNGILTGFLSARQVAH